MTADELLAELTGLGVTLRVEGDHIRYGWQGDTLTPYLQREMEAHKQELIGLLRSRNGKHPLNTLNTLNTQPKSNWPEALGAAALHGLAGDVVRTIGPQTEADDAALLFNFLAAFGNAVGRTPYAAVGPTRHYLNLYAVVVGETSQSRKGTGWNAIQDLIYRVDETWANTDHIIEGLSSGEGLIFHVRDKSEKTVALKEDGRPTGEWTTEIVDAGITDKRLLVKEEEFATVLKVMEREGNTLSPVIRQAWDTGNLRVLTRNSPLKATMAHISILGQTTQEELLRHLNDTEYANGFANRFLWICVRRSKELPDGGGQPRYGDIVPRLHTALERGRKIGLIQRDEVATELWAEFYHDLTSPVNGLLGSITARAAAQVLRLSALYAVLDSSCFIEPVHLMAGLEVWRYAEASAKYIFGNALGDPTADTILMLLQAKPDGATRTEIYKSFAGHKPSTEIDRAYLSLARQGRVRCESYNTAGRPVEKWFLAA